MDGKEADQRMWDSNDYPDQRKQDTKGVLPSKFPWMGTMGTKAKKVRSGSNLSSSVVVIENGSKEEDGSRTLMKKRSSIIKIFPALGHKPPPSAIALRFANHKPSCTTFDYRAPSSSLLAFLHSAGDLVASCNRHAMQHHRLETSACPYALSVIPYPTMVVRSTADEPTKEMRRYNLCCNR